jgi:hypothetical protein
MRSRRAFVVCHPDEYANAVKPTRLVYHLRSRGLVAEIFSTRRLSRARSSGLRAKLPGLQPRKLALYAMEVLEYVALKCGVRYERIARSLFLVRMMRIRGALIADSLIKEGCDLVISEHNADVGLVAGARVAREQLLDLPSPFAEELYIGGRLSRRAFEKLRAYEVQMYGRADHVSFHWHTYADFVRENKYSGPNLLDFSYGTDPKEVCARWSAQPRIVFLGYLGGYWANLPLLLRLCERFPNIEVYGGPRVPELGERYKGYAPDTDVLAQYQFGLITITDDPLRRSSFSSKQLEYYSYGLPVLTPAWRRDEALDPAALHYTEESIGEILAANSTEETWTRLSTEALGIAKRFSWDAAFAALDPILERLEQ